MVIDLFFILLGVFFLIVRANSWFYVPDLCLWVCIAVIAIRTAWKVITILFIKDKLDKHSERKF